jgi:multidrug resistance efflux pump
MSDSSGDKTSSESVAGGDAGQDLAGLRRITLAAIAVAVVVFIYFVVADRTTPFTGSARVQAFVVRIASEVAGQVRSVDVGDNAIVDQGATLFRIDPTPYQIAVDQAQARLKQAGQTIGASTASVESAQARLDEARAVETNVRSQSARTLELVNRGVYAKSREDQALSAIEQASAGVASADAELRSAKEELGPEGQDNPKVQEAIAELEKARFDLSRTTVSAPSRGVVTNLQLAGGQTVSPGQVAMTFISVEDVWLLASIRENSLGVLESGQRAEVVLDTLPGRVFDAKVRSIGWGVAGGAVDPATGLPKSSDESGWLTDQERFAVQLVFDTESQPRGARYGSRAAVIIYASDNPVMRAIAWCRIRLIALLTYVS